MKQTNRIGRKADGLVKKDLGGFTETDYLGDLEFVRFMAENCAPVANVVPSVAGKLVECIEIEGKVIYVGFVEPENNEGTVLMQMMLDS